MELVAQILEGVKSILIGSGEADAAGIMEPIINFFKTFDFATLIPKIFEMVTGIIAKS